MLLNHSPRQSVNTPRLLRHVSATPKDRQADSDLALLLTDKRDRDKRPMELTFCRYASHLLSLYSYLLTDRSKGKWYRLHEPRSCIRSPNEPETVRRIKPIIASLDNLEEWESVSFPSPLQSNLDYVYTIDIDAGTLTFTRWESFDGLLQSFPGQIPLSCLDGSHGLTLDPLTRVPGEV
ncbi:hypothetical protein PAAG_11372 [Paracoccidioides lutzii Pb01]|uniref:Uncharacterized protein n=1 Tax=Paracoccidioides lutzii (strain ATCC MYA-826 / Pb01) TaxID=502779 RepID=A0A0A2V1Z1_PARBA|nr:hypothetical protein PAAG_11372 [Paracoccidioides lutzii Pb01]KGQ01801.1 hypothetical protein PAAG_11372 [Paracoccidioides lutzii Pb01]